MSELIELVHKGVSGTQLNPQNLSFTGADDVKLACWIAGSGPLVVAHSPGWGCGMEYMTIHFLPLTEKYTLLCVKSRATPPSSRPDESKMSSAHMAEDLEALRVLLEVEKLTVLGHSNGAAVAQAYAVAYPPRVDKLLLICAELIGGTPTMEASKRFIDARADHPVYSKAFPGLAKAFAAPTDEEVTAGIAQLMPYYFAHPESDDARKWQDVMASSTVSRWALHAQSALDSVAPMPQLEKVQAKTLIVLGEEDWICTNVWANKIHELIPRSELAVFKDCGHMPWHEADDFWPTVLRFLET